MTDQVQQIPDFPTYGVTPYGAVLNINTGREMKLALNQRGIVYVGLVRDGQQYKRSVALLVAQAFLGLPQHDSFDSVIHLDGDKTNCIVTNLMWRPQHFVINYHKQFVRSPIAYIGPLYCPETEEIFPSSREMAMQYGLLERDIIAALVNGYMIWPTRLTIVSA